MIRIVVLATAFLLVSSAEAKPRKVDLPDFDKPHFPANISAVLYNGALQDLEYVDGFTECTIEGTVIELPKTDTYTVVYGRGKSQKRCVFYVRSPSNSYQTVTCYSRFGLDSSFAYSDGSAPVEHACTTQSQDASGHCFKKLEWSPESTVSGFLLESGENYEEDFMMCEVTALPTTSTASGGTGDGPTELQDCECGRKAATARIVGGEEAADNEFPYAARLIIVTPDGTYLCGGSLVSDQFIVTAAHCTRGQTSMSALLGANSDSEPEGINVNVLEVIDHPGYISTEKDNDISLLRISPIDFTATDRIRPACLPTGSDSYEGTIATAIGWGTVLGDATQYPEGLMKVDLPVISNARCSTKFSTITSSMICAGGEEGESVCRGDSGSSLLNENSGNFYELIGATSFGGEVCGEEGLPAVFTRITDFLPWINEQISQSSICRRPN